MEVIFVSNQVVVVLQVRPRGWGQSHGVKGVRRGKMDTCSHSTGCVFCFYNSQGVLLFRSRVPDKLDIHLPYYSCDFKSVP